MNNEFLETKIRLIDGKAKLSGTARENPEVIMDYFPPIGSGEGYTSLELFLLSFSSCVSTTLMALLRNKIRKTVVALEASTKGTVREEHPKSLSHIDLELRIVSSDVQDEDIQKVIAAAEEKMCPVWAMIKGNVTSHISYTIHRQ